ncbi:putative phage tail protein [Cetobacterium sp.]|uniref:putative phage tail protein n=1 Tax=Cetobacterium sp. TaxID=2071632 RepID=UPI003F40227D
MSHKDGIIKNLHKVFRTDPYINNLLGVGGGKLDELSVEADNIEKEYWFDTMTAIGIAIMENQMDYKCMSKDIEAKREEIEGRWKISGKCDLQLLQAIANSWRNGQVVVMFTNAVIEITFISITGIPLDVETLKASIEEAKPAHLPIKFNFRYRVWGQLPPKTWGYYKKYTWEEILKKEGI